MTGRPQSDVPAILLIDQFLVGTSWDVDGKTRSGVGEGWTERVMRQVTFALRFHGEAHWTGIDGNVMSVAALASGRQLRTWIGPAGVKGSVRSIPGEEAVFDAELTLTGKSTFQGTGTFTFGTGDHRLHFSSAGNGHLHIFAASAGRHGAAIWQIDKGEGQFHGAAGLIVSNFVLSEAAEFTDHQLAVIFVV